MEDWAEKEKNKGRSSLSSKRFTSEFENQQKFVGKKMNGYVVDTKSGKCPVMTPYREAPNVIVKNERAGDWEEGDEIKVEVTNAKDTYMFGTTFEDEVSEDDPDEGDFRILIYIVGNTFESKVFNSRKQAESVKKFVEKQYEDLEVEIERDR